MVGFVSSWRMRGAWSMSPALMNSPREILSSSLLESSISSTLPFMLRKSSRMSGVRTLAGQRRLMPGSVAASRQISKRWIKAKFFIALTKNVLKMPSKFWRNCKQRRRRPRRPMGRSQRKPDSREVWYDKGTSRLSCFYGHSTRWTGRSTSRKCKSSSWHEKHRKKTWRPRRGRWASNVAGVYLPLRRRS